jgi:hypothetical protein
MDGGSAENAGAIFSKAGIQALIERPSAAVFY